MGDTLLISYVNIVQIIVTETYSNHNLITIL